MSARRGLILPVVLVLVGLLALMMAGFMFFVRAELAGMEAQRDEQQARLAAESGFEEVVTVLRASPDDPTAWFDVPARFRNALVWAESYTRAEDPVLKMGSRKDLLAQANPIPAWRYSVVAENMDGLPNTIRFGVTPEASKLNLNTASETELQRLMTDVLPGLGVENIPELLAALLDWREPGDTPRPGGAKDEYYTNLVPGYKTKKGPFDSVEELLLVKGFSAALLYGEDTNRNGLLDANEDDGTDSFPYYDNGNGELDRGLAPYLTVWSREPRASAPDPNNPGQSQDPNNQSQGQPQQQGQPSDKGQPQGQGQPTDQGGAPTQGGASPTGAQQQPSDSTKAGAKQQDKQAPQAAGQGTPSGKGGMGQGPGVAPSPGQGQKPGQGQAPGQNQQPGQGQSADQAAALEALQAAGLGQLLGSQGQGQGQQQQAMKAGFVNVNTAPLRVLRVLDGMPPEAAEAIVNMRQQLSGDVLKNSDWIMTSGAVDGTTYAAIKDKITTKALQFHVEIIGYADHTKLARRYEWIIEMRGPLAQVLYHRDLTSLGIAWPVDDDKFVVSGH